MILGLVLKYLNGERFVIADATNTPCSLQPSLIWQYRSITTVVCDMHHARTSKHDAVDEVFSYRSSYFRFNHLRRLLTVIIKSEDRHAACP
jgi:hypothetical protein